MRLGKQTQKAEVIDVESAPGQVMRALRKLEAGKRYQCVSGQGTMEYTRVPGGYLLEIDNGAKQFIPSTVLLNDAGWP